MIESIQKKSLVDEVIHVIRHNIQNDVWAVDEKIPTEPELVQGLGVGRNTIREAIKILEYFGILEVKQGLGTFVRARNDFSIVINSLHDSDLYEHLEVRCLLEIEIAKLAARNSTIDDMQYIVECLKHRESTSEKDVPNFMLNDKKLHLAIAKSTHNRALYATYEYFLNSSYQYTLELVTNKNLPDPTQEIHNELVEAIDKKSEIEAMQIAELMLTPILHSLASIKSSTIK